MSLVESPTSSGVAAALLPPGDPLIGRVIGNYEIQSVLAEGGMGKVYLAVHPVMGRRAAVKILRGAYVEDQQMVARFMNEARAANAIHHPNIVEILDVGYLPDGPPYLKMEFLEGETLGQRLAREGRLTPVQAVALLDQAASALQAAHTAGIVHRDLKPDNLFVIPDPIRPGVEVMKVVDFGIAKLEGPGVGSSVHSSGVVLGTPNYMSPEQCRGTGVDQRADIYALGAILYEALCGRPPFVAQSPLDVMMMHVVQPPRAPRDLFPDLPEHLNQVAMRALAKKPAHRYSSMDELRAAMAGQAAGASGAGGGGASVAVPNPAGLATPAASQGAYLARARRLWPWIMLAVSLGTGGGWLAASRSVAYRRGHHDAVVVARPAASAVNSPPVPLAAPAEHPPASVKAPALAAPPPPVRPGPAARKKDEGVKKWMDKW